MAEGGQTRFRNSFTHREGSVPAEVMQGMITNVNMNTWTVDFFSAFDRKRYKDVQVSAGYAHFARGEGIYAMPEVGARCALTIPGDSSPPFISSFLMPFENVDMATGDAPNGTTSQSDPNSSASGSSFAGGRGRAKPGDIMMKGRDGNFVILHRGGMLQVGSTQLAQRMYIPLNNMIVDMAENYHLHTQGGTEYWGVTPGNSGSTAPTEYFQTFRVSAFDKYADVRIKASKVVDPLKGQLDKDAALTADVVYEITVAPQGFDAEAGAVKDAKATTLRFAFDKQGNALYAGKGEVSIYFQKKLTLRSDNTVVIQAGKNIEMKASSGATIDGGAFAHLKGGVVKLGPGGTPVAMQGGMVQLTIPPIPPGGIPIPTILYGIITTGNPTVLV